MLVEQQGSYFVFDWETGGQRRAAHFLSIPSANAYFRIAASA
jgi:hypothetical protein